ncbi:MAG: hypothetical protein AAF962_04270 [Actinomycetota bacterium]
MPRLDGTIAESLCHGAAQAPDRTTTVNDRVSDIRQDLENLSEQLAELAIDVLREAVDEGATSRPPLEKQLTQARRAVEKAVRALDGA